MDRNLTWNEDYKKLKYKIKATLSSFQTLKNILTQYKLDQVHKVVFGSHLIYSDELRGNLLRTKLQHIQRPQNRAKTLIENSRFKDGWKCNWLSISNTIQFDKEVMVYTILNGLCPDNLEERLVLRSQLLNYYTRN